MTFHPPLVRIWRATLMGMAATSSAAAFAVVAPAPGTQLINGQTFNTSKCASERWPLTKPAGVAANTCRFEGTRSVAFGAKGKFVILTATGSIDCSTAVFGDPIKGTGKACYTNIVTLSNVTDTTASSTIATPAASLATPPAKQVKPVTTGAWKDVTMGLPEGSVPAQLAVIGNTVFTGINTSMGKYIYRFDVTNPQAGWVVHTRLNDPYKANDLIAVDGELFVGGHNTAYWISQESGPDGKAIYSLGAAPGGVGNMVAGRGRIITQNGGDGSPKVWTLNIQAIRSASASLKAAALLAPVGQRQSAKLQPLGTWVDTGLNISVNNAKPHTQLFEDGQQNIWYVTNYADNATNNGGSFKYDGRQWSKQFGALSQAYGGGPGTGNAPGYFSVTRNGSMLVSFERAPSTQISSTFRYDPTSTSPFKEQGALVPVSSSPGYGVGSFQFDTDKNVVLASRFGHFVLGGSGAKAGLKRWQLPDAMEGYSLSDEQKLRTTIRSAVTTTDGTIVAYQEDGVSAWRMIAYKPDMSKLPYYNGAIDLESGAVLGQTDAATEAMTVRWLDAGSLLAAFNSTGTVSGGETCVKAFAKAACGQGALTTLTPFGAVMQTLRLDSSVLDMELRTLSGVPHAALALADGFAVLDLRNNSVVATQANAGARRIDLSPSGRIATLAYNGSTQRYEVKLYAGMSQFAANAPTFTYQAQRSYVEDVVVADQQPAQPERVVLVGFDNKRLPGGNPVQVAFAQGLDLTGASQWTKFGFNGADLSSNIADTRLYRARINALGTLYITGETAGSQSIFRYNGNVFSGPEMLSYTDFYNQLWNTGSAHESYYAQLNPATGAIEQSQLAMSRLSSGKSNTFRVRDIAAANDRVFMPAVGAASIGNRNANVLNGRPVGEYAGGDPVLLAVDGKNFANRLAWTTLSRSNGATGDMRSVDVFGSKVALFGFAKANGSTTASVGCGAGDCSVDTVARPYLVVLDSEVNFGLGR